MERFQIQHSRTVDRLSDLSFIPKTFNPTRTADQPGKPDRKSIKRQTRTNSTESRRLSGIQANYELVG